MTPPLPHSRLLAPHKLSNNKTTPRASTTSATHLSTNHLARDKKVSLLGLPASHRRNNRSKFSPTRSRAPHTIAQSLPADALRSTSTHIKTGALHSDCTLVYLVFFPVALSLSLPRSLPRSLLPQRSLDKACEAENLTSGFSPKQRRWECEAAEWLLVWLCSLFLHLRCK